MSLQSRLSALITAIGADIKNIRSEATAQAYAIDDLYGIRSEALTQWVTQRGQIEQYWAIANGGTITGYGAAQPFTWQVTPTEDCYLDAELWMSIIQKTSAEYSYAHPKLNISPTLEDGTNEVLGDYVNQHNAVQTYEPRRVTVPKDLLLRAGVQYTFSWSWIHSGGTWSFYQGRKALWHAWRLRRANAVGIMPPNTATTPVETPRLVNDAGQPAFINNWVNFAGVYQPLRFWKDPLGNVHIQGMIKAGSENAVVFTLPDGYKPPSGVDISCTYHTGTAYTPGECTVNTAGEVRVYPSVGRANSNEWKWIHGYFRAGNGAVALTSPTKVSALPSAPEDGMEVRFQTPGMQGNGDPPWHLMYDGALGKWAVLGGPSLAAALDTSASAAVTVYSAVFGGAGPPLITLPLQGDYLVEHGCGLTSNSSNIAYASYSINGAAATDTDSLSGTGDGSGQYITQSRAKPKLGLPAGPLVMRFRTALNTVYVQKPWIKATPKYVW